MLYSLFELVITNKLTNCNLHFTRSHYWNVGFPYCIEYESGEPLLFGSNDSFSLQYLNKAIMSDVSENGFVIVYAIGPNFYPI